MNFRMLYFLTGSLLAGLLLSFEAACVSPRERVVDDVWVEQMRVDLRHTLLEAVEDPSQAENPLAVKALVSRDKKPKQGVSLFNNIWSAVAREHERLQRDLDRRARDHITVQVSKVLKQFGYKGKADEYVALNRKGEVRGNYRTNSRRHQFFGGKDLSRARLQASPEQMHDLARHISRQLGPSHFVQTEEPIHGMQLQTNYRNGERIKSQLVPVRASGDHIHIHRNDPYTLPSSKGGSVSKRSKTRWQKEDTGFWGRRNEWEPVLREWNKPGKLDHDPFERGFSAVFEGLSSRSVNTEACGCCEE